MSIYSERVRKALYAKMTVPSVLASGTGLATGVFHAKAPDNTRLPYIIFQYQAPEPLEYAMGGPTLVSEPMLWVIQGFADRLSSVSKSPESVAEQMVQDALAAIGNDLTLTGGGEVVWVARVSDTPPLESQQGDRYVYQRGFLLRVIVE